MDHDQKTLFSIFTLIFLLLLVIIHMAKYNNINILHLQIKQIFYLKQN